MNSVIVATRHMASIYLATHLTFTQSRRGMGYVGTVLLEGVVLVTLPALIFCNFGPFLFLTLRKPLIHFLTVVLGSALCCYMTQLITPSAGACAKMSAITVSAPFIWWLPPLLRYETSGLLTLASSLPDISLTHVLAHCK